MSGKFVKGIYEAAARGDIGARDGQVVRFQQYTDTKQWTECLK